MTQYAVVALNKSVSQGFTYHIPDELRGQIQPGHLVHVPFRTGQEAGIVIECTDEAPQFTTKPVLDILDTTPVVSPVQLSLAQHLAETLLAPIGPCVWLMLPPGFTPRRDTRYSLVSSEAEPEDAISARILSLLARRGPLHTGQLQNSLGAQKNWLPQMQDLVKAGQVATQSVLAPPRTKPKTIRAVQLAITPDEIPEVIPQLGRESKRANVVEVLLAQPDRQMQQAKLLNTAGCSDSVLKTLATGEYIQVEDATVTLTTDPTTARAQIIQWRGAQPYIDILQTLAAANGALDAASLYEQTGTQSRHLTRLHKDGLIVFIDSHIWRDPLQTRHYQTDTPPDLTPGQAAAWETLQPALTSGEPSVFLLHGVTGSGKTEIYLRAVQEVLTAGQNAIILVPEIALTPQMVARFMARFPGQVGLVHSTLSAGERYDTWRRARRNELRVIIGARSALFTPLPNVGLIVLDEEHDNSYKQSPPLMPPYYHARQASIAYIHLTGGTVILGSATPDLVTYVKATQTGEYRYLHLPERVIVQTSNRIQGLPPVQIVDMRQELRMGHTSIFSRGLQTALREVLDANQQAILFLNRRGSASFVFCRDCGYIHKCPRCDTPLTYHQHQTALKCHHCGHQGPNPSTCPSCSSTRIKFFGGGTQRVLQQLQAEFAGVRALRWDRDTTTHKDAHTEIYEAFAQHEADVLIGTQMVAKGLDLPNVTLVGVISADTGLGLPDYRAGEVTFQLVTQVSGRAGRGLAAGRVFVQTYQPENYAIRAAAEHDYETFAVQEIGYRQQHHWPPYARLARVLFLHHDAARVQTEATRVAQQLAAIIREGGHTASELIGPVPCFFSRLDNVFRHHILLRSPNPTAIVRQVDVGNLAHIDIDPLDIL
ncbi:MAG: primosomal protein N' [Anaerolineales bacterium]